MTRSDVRAMVWVAALGLVLSVGCERQPEEPVADRRPATRSIRESRSAPTSSRASQDDSLYGQILETLQRENKTLKRQVQETADKCAELEAALKEVKVERAVALKAYMKVSESIESLQADAGSKDARIKELEEANRTQEQTIAQLNEQLDQVLFELNDSDIAVAGSLVADPNR